MIDIVPVKKIRIMSDNIGNKHLPRMKTKLSVLLEQTSGQLAVVDLMQSAPNLPRILICIGNAFCVLIKEITSATSRKTTAIRGSSKNTILASTPKIS